MMKSFKLSLFLFIILWSSVFISSIDENEIPSDLEQHQSIKMIRENDLNATDINIINMTSDPVDYTTQDLQKICHAQTNEIIWKLPTTISDEENFLKFHTINDRIGYSNSDWYLKSINEIDIFEIHPNLKMHQIEFTVKIKKRKIYLSRVYPTYPSISGFEILQFIANLAFECNFYIDVIDAADISPIYYALYGTGYYEYHFNGIDDLSENFSFKNITVEKKIFLDCFESKINSHLVITENLFKNLSTTEGVFHGENLPQLFYQNIQACEKSFVPVEFCPITLNTHRIVYEISFQSCLDWSSFGEFPGITRPTSHVFKITSKDMNRIMNKKTQANNMNFVKLDKTVIKTYDEIKTQICEISFLKELFSEIFELCFIELEKQKFNPNPEDILKLYLRPCVIPNINLFLKYYTDI